MQAILPCLTDQLLAVPHNSSLLHGGASPCTAIDKPCSVFPGLHKAANSFQTGCDYYIGLLNDDAIFKTAFWKQMKAFPAVQGDQLHVSVGTVATCSAAQHCGISEQRNIVGRSTYLIMMENFLKLSPCQVTWHHTDRRSSKPPFTRVRRDGSW